MLTLIYLSIQESQLMVWCSLKTTLRRDAVFAIIREQLEYGTLTNRTRNCVVNYAVSEATKKLPKFCNTVCSIRSVTRTLRRLRITDHSEFSAVQWLQNF